MGTWSRDAGTQNWGFPLFNLSGSRKRAQERVLMLRPVRPCVPVAAGRGCAEAPSKQPD